MHTHTSIAVHAPVNTVDQEINNSHKKCSC